MTAPYVIALSGAQNHHCCYCHLPMLTNWKPAKKIHRSPPRNMVSKDHVVPRCYGGPTTVDNLVAACVQCNSVRGSLDAETFYLVIQGWFRHDQTLRDRWHNISSEELGHFCGLAEQIDKVKWERRIKQCKAASALNDLVPIPLPPHTMRA